MKTEEESVYDQILEKIKGYDGKPFVVNDFYDIGNYENIKKSLQRMAAKRIINRISRGMYYTPLYLQALERYSDAGIDDIAYALARQNGWTICPDINQSLNMLGLSEQVPNKCEYLSDGPYREYDYDGNTITFKHASSKCVSPIYSFKTMVIIQAIRGLEKENITKDDIIAIRKTCDDSDLTKMLEEGKMTNIWIYDVIKKIGDKSYV